MPRPLRCAVGRPFLVNVTSSCPMPAITVCEKSLGRRKDPRHAPCGALRTAWTKAGSTKRQLGPGSSASADIVSEVVERPAGTSRDAHGYELRQMLG